jgi:hypothetical protein
MSLVKTELWQQVTGNLPDDAAKGMIVRFELVAVPDEARTDAEGRPHFNDVEYIEVRSPNDHLSVVHRAVEEKDKRMYPQAYRAFKEGAADPLSGTPLREWPPIAKSQFEYLGFRGIRTVEQFADVSDDGVHQMGAGYLTLRNKAIAWLAKAKDGSQVTKMAAELQKRDVEIQSLQRQLSELIAKLEDAPTPKRSKNQ